MGAGKAVLVFLIACVVLGLLFAMERGGSVLQGIGPVFSGDPAVYEARQQTRAAQAEEAGQQAQILREARAATTAAQLTHSAEEQAARNAGIARQTEAVAAQTQAVYFEQTKEAWQVTVAAGQAQGTATAQAQVTAVLETQQAVALQKTADAASLNMLATQYMQTAVQGDLLQERERVRLERDRAFAWLPYLAAAIALVAVLIFVGMWLKIKDDSTLPLIPHDQYGNSLTAVKGGMVIAPDLMLSPALAVDKRQAIPAAALPSAQQDKMNQLNKAVQGIRALRGSGLKQDARVQSMALNQAVGAGMQEQLGAGEENTLPQIAPWESLASWRGGAFPLGIGEGNRGIVMEPNRVANLMIAGTTNSGKTMSGVRPLMAEALASGWMVVAMNEKGGDFTPLQGHVNFVSVEGDAQKVLDTLRAVVLEVERRSALLKQMGTSTYSRTPGAGLAIGPRIMVVIDEVVALITGAPRQLRGELWQALIEITSKCRAMGVMVVLATTDPTYRTLGREGLTVRDNCARMVFRVRDMSSSRAALDAPGAEGLSGAQFIAQLDGGPVRGVAFRPDDAQVKKFLEGRQVEALPAAAWLELPAGEPVGMGPVVGAPGGGAVIDPATRERILALHRAGESMNSIQRQVFGFTGGSAYATVKTVLDSSTTGSTTTTDSGSTGDFDDEEAV